MGSNYNNQNGFSACRVGGYSFDPYIFSSSIYNSDRGGYIVPPICKCFGINIKFLSFEAADDGVGESQGKRI